MLKSKYWYACLTAGLVLSIPLSAVAKLAANGTGMNGTGMNGTGMNGVRLNGTGFNGVSFNGTDLNTSQITPANTKGVLRVEGGQLVIQTSPVAPVQSKFP